MSVKLAMHNVATTSQMIS